MPLVYLVSIALSKRLDKGSIIPLKYTVFHDYCRPINAYR